ncbi:MAG: hypothetical protein WCK86_11725 [Planctomycetia bacterium]
MALVQRENSRVLTIFGDPGEIVIWNWHSAAAIFLMTGYSCQGLRRVEWRGVVL